MNDGARWRASGCAAIGGGVLRIAGSFSAGALDARTLQYSYLLTDVALLFGLIGIYLSRRDLLRWAADLAFSISVVGILLIRSAALLGANGYVIGAGVLLIGLSVLSVALLVRLGGKEPAALLWLGSLACGLLGTAAPGAALWTALAGVTFGLGFVVAGVALLRRT